MCMHRQQAVLPFLLTTDESMPIAGVDFHRLLASVEDTTGTSLLVLLTFKTFFDLFEWQLTAPRADAEAILWVAIKG